MNITIAAWHLKDFNVGLGRYARGLIEAIGRVDTENHYDILMPDHGYPFPEHPNIRYRVIRFPVFKRRFWEQVAPFLVKSDLLHFPYDSVVIWKRGKFIVTVHDVKPLILGTPHSRWSPIRTCERVLIGDRWRRIDHILTVSHRSKRDIIEHTGYSSDRLSVVYNGIDLQHFRPRSPAQADKRRPYILCVAGADPTKNVEVLIQAFGRLPVTLREAHEVMVVGDLHRRSSLLADVQQAGIEKQTIFTGIVSDERLVELYQDAALFVFPSLYEGFGLPVLEAMACGCPVICSETSSLPEVAGDAAILFNPTDVETLAQQMERVLSDVGLRQRMAAKGLAQAAKFSWDRTARETIAVYKKVISKSLAG